MELAAGNQISEAQRAVGRLALGRDGEERVHESLGALLHGNLKDAITGGDHVAHHAGTPTTPSTPKSHDGLKK